MQRVFDQANIIECVINEEELMAFLLRQDVNDVGEKYFPFKDLAQTIIILLFLLYQTCINPLAYTLEMLLISVVLPFIFTTIVIPYLYCFTIYGSYEMWFIRLKRGVCGEKIEYVRRRNLLIRHCGLNLRKLKYFEKHIQLFMIRDYDEFLQAVHICELGYRKV